MNEILELLQNDARLTPEEIAAMLKKDVKVIRKKIKQLEDDGVIVKYGAVINPEKVPNKKEVVRAIIELSVTPERETGFDTLAERIYKFPQVESVYLISGGYDLQVIIEGKTLKEVAFFVSEKLAPLDGVRGTKTHFVLKKYKENGAVLSGKEKSSRLSVAP
ncbi:DNA-binding transcriptional regulator Lrp family [Candidatus Termititenax aidoneus]|uniref:DNA-binding transcriptional regulator Lrp family n=1 Tax=Termititenax aidoneus TaxID=2218524 RepID=A0A388TC91_TERA1|nr:DNA-binding transcriptional regulator Lrp family [Candidatus Termititenax aidoneus]